MTAKVTFQTDRCKGCELCVTACPKHIVAIDTGVINRKGYHPAGASWPAGIREFLPRLHIHLKLVDFPALAAKPGLAALSGGCIVLCQLRYVSAAGRVDGFLLRRLLSGQTGPAAFPRLDQNGPDMGDALRYHKPPRARQHHPPVIADALRVLRRPKIH